MCMESNTYVFISFRHCLFTPSTHIDWNATWNPLKEPWNWYELQTTKSHRMKYSTQELMWVSERVQGSNWRNRNDNKRDGKRMILRWFNVTSNMKMLWTNVCKIRDQTKVTNVVLCTRFYAQHVFCVSLCTCMDLMLLRKTRVVRSAAFEINFE